MKLTVLAAATAVAISITPVANGNSLDGHPTTRSRCLTTHVTGHPTTRVAIDVNGVQMFLC